MNIRKATHGDISAITKLYQEVAKLPNGIARTEEEISLEYVTDFVSSALKKGLIFVIENPQNSAELIAEIHCYKFDPACFDCTFGNLTLVIHPAFHGQGLGKKIFAHLINETKANHPEIRRIELNVRENNEIGIRLYKALGFELEGVCKNRIIDSSGKVSNDSMMALYIARPLEA